MSKISKRGWLSSISGGHVDLIRPLWPLKCREKNILFTTVTLKIQSNRLIHKKTIILNLPVLEKDYLQPYHWVYVLDTFLVLPSYSNADKQLLILYKQLQLSQLDSAIPIKEKKPKQSYKIDLMGFKHLLKTFIFFISFWIILGNTWQKQTHKE